jgi:N-acyl-L-homoserine lactone synthetase
MVMLIDRTNSADHEDLLREMHRVRKAVFVDRLKWDVPVVEGEYEIDQFDTENAVYLVNVDEATGQHLASVRLLSSTKPHVLAEIFPALCQDGPPNNSDTWEITRLCTSPGLPRDVAARARHKLAVALVEYGLLHGIRRYTCVIEVQNIPALIAPGWCCNPLGPPMEINGALLGAFALSIVPTTLDLMVKRWGGSLPVLEFPQRKAA